MTPNPWLLAALIVTTISAAVWAYLAEPWLVHFEKKFDNLQQLLH